MTIDHYYNDNNEFVCEWLRYLIKYDQIPLGVVDCRSILDIDPHELVRYRCAHFFAGIGGWALALEYAKFPNDIRVWTGSPPCQPFSVIGLQVGKDDPRHLSPKFAELIIAGRPNVIFGEQVDSPQVFGKNSKPTKQQSESAPEWCWIDDISDRLEESHYAFGAADIPAAGIGAPNKRQRCYFGAVDIHWLDNGECEGLEGYGRNDPVSQRRKSKNRSVTPTGRDAGLVTTEFGSEWVQPIASHHPFWQDADWLYGRDGKFRPVEPGSYPLDHGLSGRMGKLCGYGNAINPHAAKVFIEEFTIGLQPEIGGY